MTAREDARRWAWFLGLFALTFVAVGWVYRLSAMIPALSILSFSAGFFTAKAMKP